MPIAHHVVLCWDAPPDPARAYWDVLVWPGGDTPPEQRSGDAGECVAHVCGDARRAEFDLEEGEYWVGVLPRSKDGARLPIPKNTGIARLLVSGSSPFITPAAPPNVSVAAAPTDLHAILSMDPKAAGDAAERLQVLEGPTADRAVLVAELPAQGSSVVQEGAALRSHSFPIPLDGHGSGEVRTLFVRSVARDGSLSAATQVNSIRPSRYGYEAIAVMEIEGTTRTGIAAPGVSDGWELDATDGVRLREYPLFGSWSVSWPDSLMDSQPLFARYISRAVLTSDEKDFGHKLLFSLDAWGQWSRKSATIPTIGDWAGIYPLFPASDPTLEGTTPGPAWFAKYITGDGKCRLPLPPPLWEVKWGDSSPISMAWQALVPGQFIAARYVQVRCTVTDPLGLFQVIAPKVYVKAWVPRRVAAGSGQCAGGVATLQVNLANDPITGVSPWQNQMIVVLQSKTVDQLVYLTGTAPAGSPPNFTVTHRTLAAATPGAATDFDYYVTGY